MNVNIIAPNSFISQRKKGLVDGFFQRSEVRVNVNSLSKQV